MADGEWPMAQPEGKKPHDSRLIIQNSELLGSLLRSRFGQILHNRHAKQVHDQ
jgi:hypothetical protein